MTSAQTLIDQELAQFGWIESVATNSINDFKSQKSTLVEQKTDEKNYDLIDTFICQLIFYVILCYCLILYIVIDLGFGSFVKNKMTALFKLKRKTKISTFIATHSN